MVRVGINGFGSIGRRFLRATLDDSDINVVAVNHLADVGTLSHLLKYDSTYGTLKEEVAVTEDGFSVDGHQVKLFCGSEPCEIPWHEAGVDLVLECTGKFTAREKAQGHIDPGGAKRVVIAASGKGADVTVVMGVNHEDYDPSAHRIISNASCTTNCLAPVAKVLDSAFGIEEGLMTTVHAYTNDQKILDKTHKDLRRARAGALSIIPTTTGAAKAVSLVLPEMEGKLNGMALRVPIPAVSLVDLTVYLKKRASADEINKAFEDASKGALKGILGVSYKPLVSVDYIGLEESTVIDGLSTTVVGNLAKVLAWYDNEWGYVVRLRDLISFVGSRGL